jgi:hypothetical protein
LLKHSSFRLFNSRENGTMEGRSEAGLPTHPGLASKPNMEGLTLRTFTILPHSGTPKTFEFVDALLSYRGSEQQKRFSGCEVACA